MENNKNIFQCNKISILCIIIGVLFIISIVLIIKNMTKNQKNGNNMNSQEIVDSLLNLNSYKAKIKVQVNSNKNKNKYILWQEYNSENGCIQEVIEPENIAGIKITKKDNILNIENTNLNLKTIFDNYIGLEDNSLDLINFVNEFKESNKSKYEEKDGEIKMILKSSKRNKYIKNKVLYIDKESVLPKKLIIKDDNQNMTISIEYIEIELN